MYKPKKIEIDDIVILRKSHPCGGNEFEIKRPGMDFRMKCLKCGKEVWIPRTELERRIKTHLRNGEKVEDTMEKKEKIHPGLFQCPVEMDDVVLECRDANSLASFYCKLLGWTVSQEFDGEWMGIAAASGVPKITFRQNEDYMHPVWPQEEGQQQQVAHLNFIVHSPQEMMKAVEYAIFCGADLAKVQYNPQEWMTLIDPQGHPFCLVLHS